MNPMRKALISAALVATTLTGGAVGATLVGGANAASTPSTTAPASSTSSSTDAPSASMPEHGSAAHESAETAVTGDAATKAQAAAVKDVGSGTAGAVTSDFKGGGYETTVTKADGTQVEVHLDSSFAVQQGGPGH